MTRICPKMKWWLGLALLGLTLPQAQAQTPNIIVVFADDMGYGDVGCYNPESRIPTPNMDRLATQGIRFTDAHSADSVCTPSRMTRTPSALFPDKSTLVAVVFVQTVRFDRERTGLRKAAAELARLPSR